MSKATQKQLELIAALGFFEGRDIKKESAGKIIAQAKEQGIKPDWAKKDAVELKIIQIMKRRCVAALKSANNKGADAETIKVLEEELEEWECEVEDYKEDLKDQKEDERDRINDIHEQIEGFKGYKRLTKKPTKAEVKAVVEAMDEAKRGWENDKNADRDLINNLASNFTHLRTKKPRPSSGKKKKKSGGCLKWIFYIIVAMVIYFTFLQKYFI